MPEEIIGWGISNRVTDTTVSFVTTYKESTHETYN